MLFNSPVFLIGFLPICLVGFYCFGIAGRQHLALAWLTGMSVVFYAWHQAKQAIGPFVAPLYGDLVAVIAAACGLSRKCLVLDLDNTP
jgi:hypothetical protein